jgi:hypothetical protein
MQVEPQEWGGSATSIVSLASLTSMASLMMDGEELSPRGGAEVVLTSPPDHATAAAAAHALRPPRLDLSQSFARRPPRSQSPSAPVSPDSSNCGWVALLLLLLLPEP